MTKDVIVKIEGSQSGTDEGIKTKAHGIYHFTNGNHYIQYNEKLPESNVISKNTIKISPLQVILTKRVRENSQMIFDLEEITQTTYQTPYGNLTFDIKTSSIKLHETTEKIELIMDYSLSAEANHVSDNNIIITVSSK